VSGDSGERAALPPPASGNEGEERPLPPAKPNRGAISFSSRWRERLAAGPDADPGLTEQFRRLAATLHHGHQNNDLRSVMVTSAVPGDGKTLTAVNLAVVLAESYRYNVLLLDADLRRPSIPTVLEGSSGSGLSEVLRSQSERKLALVPITPRLTLLPAGAPISNSLEALTSPRMRQIIEEAVTRFDWVVVDAPPIGAATDASILSQMVGGTLFVIHAGQTQYPEVQKAIDALGRDQILGVVLNGVESVDTEPYHYYGGDKPPRTKD
jgi:capsular exopolysaccharide synthesis family protein